MILYRREHDATAVQIGKDVDKVFQRTTNAIEFIDNKCVALAEMTETFLQHGPLFNSGDLLGNIFSQPEKAAPVNDTKKMNTSFDERYRLQLLTNCG